MSRRAIVLVALVLVAGACRKGVWGAKQTAPRQTTTTAGQLTDMKGKRLNIAVQPTPDAYLERSAIGGKVGPDGAVIEQKESFASGEPVYLTMRFNLSPPHLQSSVRILDEKGNELHRDSKDMNGAKVVTFKLPQKIMSKAGTYRVEGLWGGNTACEYKVDIRARH